MMVLQFGVLIDWFGRFPTFHDNEVLNVEMNRRGPSIMMNIYSYNDTGN